MKIIRGANRFVSRHLGLQTKERGIKYRESRFVIAEGDAKYNTLTGEALTQADKDELIEHWFLIPSDMDEIMLAYMLRQKWLQIGSGPGKNIKNRFIIFFTTACNAKCEYCFEHGLETMIMTEQTAKDIADYITDHINSDAEITLRLFGGEPLTNTTAVDVLTGKLNSRGIKYKSDLFTNGDRLPLVSDEQLNAWHVRRVQFTVDDVGKEYDRIKGLSPGAWDRLQKSISRICDAGIRASVRVHYHPGKGPDAPRRVIDSLDKRAYPYPIMLYETASKEDYDGLLSVEEMLVQRGIYRWEFPSVFIGNACMADDRRAACITPDGSLSPCEHYPYGHNYGSIYDGKYDYDTLAKWGAKQRNYCRKCALYPSCGIMQMCPAQHNCTEAEVYYKTEKIKRALREKS